MPSDKRFNGIRTGLLSKTGLSYLTVAEAKTLWPSEVRRLNDASQRMIEAQREVVEIIEQAQRMARRGSRP